MNVPHKSHKAQNMLSLEMIRIYKVIIADDRMFEREKLRGIIDWQLYGMEIVGEARNGREAFNLCLEKRPDIVVTDIRMPLMDGMVLARSLTEVLPSVKIIFISGYSDFDYAKTAIQLNVSGYLLKPYTESDLSEALRRAVDIMSEDTRKRTREERLLSIFNDNLSTLRETCLYEVITSGANIAAKDFWSRMNELGLRFESELFSMVRIDFNHADSRPINLRGRRTEIDDIIAKSLMGLVKNAYTLIDGFYCFILLEIDENLPKNDAATLLSTISAALTNGFLKCNLLISIRHSSQGYGYKSWNRMYGELCEYEQAAPTGLDETQECIYQNYKQCEKEIFDAILHQQMEYAYQFVDSITEQAASANLRGSNLTKICVSLYNQALKLVEKKSIFSDELERLLSLETPNDANKWMRDVITTTGKAIRLIKAGKNKALIDTVCERIARRYASDLDVCTLSAELYLSPNYLRQIFKEYMGKSLSCYITDFRIEKACELLRNTNHKISDIPRMVGLENNPHFYFLIKKITGFTPNEYRMLGGSPET